MEIVGDLQNLLISENKRKVIKNLTENESGKILVRDEDFNYQEIEYNVDWIGQPPIIKGAEKGKTYTTDINLEYISLYGIKEIYASSYSNTFSIFTGEENFYETESLRLVPSCRNSITACVISNTKEMEQYRYYLDDKLYATTKEKQYTFTGLKVWTFYSIKVEALDRYGNVLDSKETYRRTIPISRVIFAENDGTESISIKGLPLTTFGVGAYAWKAGQQKTRKKINFDTDNKTYCTVYVDDNTFVGYSRKVHD